MNVFDIIGRVESISPSQVATLKLCGLRFGLDVARTGSEEAVSNPSAILGTVSHRVLARSSVAGLRPETPSQARQEVERLWTESLETEMTRLRNRPRDGHLLSPEEWPGYFLQRARTIKLATTLAMERPETSVPRTGHQQGLGRTELLLQHPTRRVRGRIDRVEASPLGPVIVDWKTGSTMPGRSDGPQEEDRFRDQMRLYGALYGAVRGQWPVSARVVFLSGEIHEMPLNQADCETAVVEAEELLEAYNQTVNTDAKKLATPSVASCQHCNHRGLCDAYWENRPVTGQIDLQGVVARVATAETSGEWSMRIRVTPGNADGEDAELVGLSPKQFAYVREIGVGSNVRAIGFSKAQLGCRFFPTLRAQIVVRCSDRGPGRETTPPSGVVEPVER